MKQAQKTTAAFFLFFFPALLPQAVFSYAPATQNNGPRLEIHTLDRTEKEQVRVAGYTTPGAAVKMYVNGSDQGKVKVGKKRGKISKRVDLPAIGANEILVTAENQDGSKSVIRYVERKAVKAVDKPLWLEDIHSKNETRNPVLEIWGKAYGVSRVQVSVDNVEWGWTIVNTRTGKYKTRVRLSEGLNTVKVTGTKDDEIIIISKIVDKI